MKFQGHGGSIIAISSISALVGGAQQTHYTPTKAGVLSLMQSCACALGKYGIRCNAILPGTIKTQLNEEDLADPEKKKYMEGRIPLGRTGVPEDLAGPAVFLASDMAKYVVSFVSMCFWEAGADLSDRLEHSYLLMVGYLLISSRISFCRNIRLEMLRSYTVRSLGDSILCVDVIYSLNMFRLSQTRLSLFPKSS